MKWGRVSFLRLIMTAALLILATSPLAISGEPAAESPPAGSPLRREILTALRQRFTDLPVTPVVFIVRHLKVAGNWAYLIADLSSRDGRAHYEPVEVLLHCRQGQWEPLEFRPSGGECEEDPDCADDQRYYLRLRQKYPSVPVAIFPRLHN